MDRLHSSAVFIALLLGWAGQEVKEPEYSWKPGKADLLLSSFEGGPEAAEETVIRTREAWDAYLKGAPERMRESLAGAKVDFDKEMALVVAFGPFHSVLTAGEAALAGIRGFTEEKEATVVHYTIVDSDKRSDRATRPVFVVKAPKAAKKLEFRKRRLTFGG